MPHTKVAIVTGSNRGIGFETVKKLCEKFPGVVYLTSRDVANGKAAVESLNKLSLKPAFHQLDVLDKDSIARFAKFIKDKHGGIDVLVNNAAIAYQLWETFKRHQGSLPPGSVGFLPTKTTQLPRNVAEQHLGIPRSLDACDTPERIDKTIIKVDSPEPFGEQAEVCLATNYFGLVAVCYALFPLLLPHARVVNLTSCEGHLSKIPGQAVRDRLQDPNLTQDALTSLVNEFIESAKAGTYHETGWGRSSYRVSKNAVCALTFLQQRAFDTDPRPDIVVNAVHPGFCATNMTQYRAPLTPEQGADAPTYLALLPPNVSEPRGQFVWKDRQVISWVEPLKERF